MPTQTSDQASALGAVIALQVALQVVARIASSTHGRQAQPHIDQWREHLLAKVTRHRPGRNVEALVGTIRIIELHQ
ncbi:hypothetical protein D3C78_608230 [compost metagenome]